MSSRTNPAWTAQTKRISISVSSAEISHTNVRRKRRTCSSNLSVFTRECQQVKEGDNTVWCCQTEFLPPNFASSSSPSSSPRPLSRLQSPPLLPPLSLSSHFNPLQQSPSVQSAQEHPLCTPKNCNPNFFSSDPSLPPSLRLPLLSSNYSPASALTSSRY